MVPNIQITYQSAEKFDSGGLTFDQKVQLLMYVLSPLRPNLFDARVSAPYGSKAFRNVFDGSFPSFLRDTFSRPTIPTDV